MSDDHEYKVLRELLAIYRTQPCLWDSKSPEYKCSTKKNLAWKVLLGKFREIDPDADLAVVKRKIDNMKACYQRELRKVNKSIITAKSSADIHEPSLWYFKLLSFLTKDELCLNTIQKYRDQDEEQQNDVYMLIVDDKYEPPKRSSQDPEVSGEKFSNEKQKEVSHYTQQLRQSIQNTPKGDQDTARVHKINPFALYIGKQLEDMTAFQRKVAEKVISEVIFLGKTEQLDIHSRVESHSYPWSQKSTKRKLSPEDRPVNLNSIKTETWKRKIRHSASETEFIGEEDDESQSDLETWEKSSDSEPTFEVTVENDESSRSSVCESSHDENKLVKEENKCLKQEEICIKEEDITIKEEDSILMTLLKTK